MADSIDMSVKESNRRRAVVLIGMIVTVEAIVLLGFLGLGTAPLQVFDYQAFDRLAVNLLDHRAFSVETSAPYYGTYFRAPGYPAFIAVVYAIFGRHVLAVRMLQFVCLGLTAFLIYLLAGRFFDESASLIAGLFCATYPPLVFLAAIYTGETLSNLGLVLALLLVVDLQRNPSHPLRRGLLTGITFGITALVRPASGLLFAIAGVVLLWNGRRALRATLIAVVAIGIGYSLMVGPWVLRNRRMVGQFVGPQASGWGLYVSAQQWAGEISFGLLKPEWDAVIQEFNRRSLEAARKLQRSPALDAQGRSVVAMRELEVERGFTRDAKVKLRQVPVSQMLRRALPRLYWLWSTADMNPDGSVGVLHHLFQVWHVVLVGLTLCGLFLQRRALASQAILWITPAYVTALHFVYHVEARYTVPARPMLWIYAAVAAGVVLARVRSRSAVAVVGERDAQLSASL